MSEKTYVNLLDKITKNYKLPEGYTAWGIRSVHPDLTSSRGYRWAFPGNIATAPGPLHTSNTGGCPDRAGDGICLATTWKDMASGGISAITILLCAYVGEPLGSESYGKTRHESVLVVDVIDGARLVRERGVNANLSYADLHSANLSHANLHNADLYSANLRNADLSNADLRYANLIVANLSHANLYHANLSYANLYNADLSNVLGYVTTS